MKRLALALTLTCTLAAAPEARSEPHVYVRGTQGWTAAPAQTSAGAVTIHLDPAIIGSQATILISATPLDVGGRSVPLISAFRLNAHEFRAPVPGDVGFFPWPHTVSLMLHDSGSPLLEDTVRIALRGERTGATAPPCEVTSFSQGTWVRATLDTRNLHPDEYTLTVSATSLLGGKLDATLQFNTLGIAIPATSLSVTDSSGRLSKALPEIGTQFYRGEGPGDFVSYALPVKRSGEYGIVVHFTRCYSYGTYLVSLDGERGPHPLDGYDPELRVGAGSLNLGKRHLAAGDHCLRFELLGKDARSESRFLGLTEVILRPEPGVSPGVLRRKD
jgi:hypothetical protein